MQDMVNHADHLAGLANARHADEEERHEMVERYLDFVRLQREDDNERRETED
jgi:hypothetical protein